jgi:hypothetical protein
MKFLSFFVKMMQQQAVTAVFEYGWLMLEQDSQGHYMMF